MSVSMIFERNEFRCSLHYKRIGLARSWFVLLQRRIFLQPFLHVLIDIDVCCARCGILNQLDGLLLLISLTNNFLSRIISIHVFYLSSGPEHVLRFHGNHSHPDHFKLLELQGNNLIVGARWVLNKRDLVKKRIFTLWFGYAGTSSTIWVYTNWRRTEHRWVILS